MAFPMDFLQVFAVNMGVYLGGRKVGMAQQFLNGSKVGAVFKEMGCERMSENMWRDPFPDPDLAAILPQDL